MPRLYGPTANPRKDGKNERKGKDRWTELEMEIDVDQEGEREIKTDITLLLGGADLSPAEVILHFAANPNYRHSQTHMVQRCARRVHCVQAAAARPSQQPARLATRRT